ncbi:hypothetical protein ES708_04679 [subsurface metagenome]
MRKGGDHKKVLKISFLKKGVNKYVGLGCLSYLPGRGNIYIDQEKVKS